MFTISLHALLKDIYAIGGCLALTAIICLIYLFLAKRAIQKQEKEISFSHIWIQKKNTVFIQYGLGTIFSFLCAYGCRLVLLKILFALIYAFFIIKLFTYNTKTK